MVGQNCEKNMCFQMKMYWSGQGLEVFSESEDMD